MLLKFVQYLVYQSSVMGEVVRGGDQDVVHVNYNLSCACEFAKGCVHHCLKGAWGVYESKEHDVWFVEAQIDFEGSLPLVSFLNMDVVVSPVNIQFSEEGGILEPINKFWDQG